MRRSALHLAIVGLVALTGARAAAQDDDAAPVAPDPAPSGGTAGGSELTPRLCQNGADDDGDGAIDCDDDDCRMLVFCVNRAPREETSAEACQNGDDDDGDGDADCADPDCAAHCEHPPEQDGQPGTRGIYLPRTEPEPTPEVGFMEHDDPRRYPRRQVERPMTYLEGMLVPRLGVSVRALRFGDPLAQLGAGLSYGILDMWQVTILPVPLRLSPNFDYENPAVSSTFRLFAHEVFEIGVYANVAIPVGTAENLGAPEPLPTHHLYARSRYSDVTHVDLALLLRFHLDEWVRIDLDLPAVTIVASDPDARADLLLDARVWFSPIDYLYLGVWSGVILPGPVYDEPKVPFGFALGGTIPGSRRGPLVDLLARFGWPLFFDADPAIDEVSVDFWQLTFDVRVYTYLLP